MGRASRTKRERKRSGASLLPQGRPDLGRTGQEHAREYRVLAMHEAGHAVLSEVLGWRTGHLRIHVEQMKGGKLLDGVHDYAQNVQEEWLRSPEGRQYVENTIVACLAGDLACCMDQTAWTMQKRSADAELDTQQAIEWARLQSDDPVAYVASLDGRTRELLAEYVNEVRAVAMMLEQAHELTGDQVRNIMAQVAEWKSKGLDDGYTMTIRFPEPA